MIEIQITNAEELARKDQGWLKVFVGKAAGVDIRKRVEEEVAKRLREELAGQGVQADIVVK